MHVSKSAHNLCKKPAGFYLQTFSHFFLILAIFIWDYASILFMRFLAYWLCRRWLHMVLQKHYFIWHFLNWILIVIFIFYKSPFLSSNKWSIQWILNIRIYLSFYNILSWYLLFSEHDNSYFSHRIINRFPRI